MRKRNRCPLGRKARIGALTLAVCVSALAGAPAMATWMVLDLDRNALERVPNILLAGETRYPGVQVAAETRAGPVVNGLYLTRIDASDGDASDVDENSAQDVVSAPVLAAPVLAAGVQVEVTGLPDSGPNSGPNSASGGDAGSGYMARSHVVQMFRNDTGRWIDGEFRFPLPDGARLGGLEVRVDGELVKRLPGPDAEIGKAGDGTRLETAGFGPDGPDGADGSGLPARERDGIVHGPGGLHISVAEIGPDAVAAFIFDYSAPIVRSAGGIAQLTVPPLAMPEIERGGQGFARGSDFIRALAQTYLMDALPLPSVFDLLHSGRSAAVQVVLDAGAPLATLESPSHQFAAAMFEGALYRISLTGDPLRSTRPFVLRWKVRPMSSAGPAGPAVPAVEIPAAPDTVTEEPPVFIPGTSGISREGRMPDGLRLVGDSGGGSKAGYYYIPRVYPAELVQE